MEQAAPSPASEPVSNTDGETPGAEGGSTDPVELRQALEAERKQRKEYQRQLWELSTAREQAEQSKKSDVERLMGELTKAQERANALEQAARLRDMRDAVISQAARSGAYEPLDVFKAIADDLELDDEGRPRNVKDLLERKKKESPYMFRSNGSADGAARGGAPSGAVDMNAILRRAAGRG